MKEKKPRKGCAHCQSPTPWDAHGNLPFCSKRCKLEAQEIEHLLKLSHLRDEIKWEGKTNHIYPVYRRIIDIPDLHLPFLHKIKFEKFMEYVESLPPMSSDDFFVQGGDLHDRISDSRWAKTLNIYTPEQEAKIAKFQADSMWRRIHKRHPKAKKLQLKGNHDDRGFKRMLEKAPELEIFYNDDKMFLFENVETILDSTQRVIIKDMMIQHGHTAGGKHMVENLMKTISHHTHRGGTWFMNMQGFTIWELNGGYLGDPEQTALKYSPRRWSNWTHGFGEVLNDAPRFIPL